ncbi:DUF3828 domain-containing protein [Kosakonia sp. WA-90]|uniref:DUF3828 domain-containing protein n=1 Tax=Kosakonia sp. WA-90 TaxID=3153576 RepID=UPI00325CDF93
MRLLISLLLAAYLPFASATTETDIQKNVTAFYAFYLHEINHDVSPDNIIKMEQMNKWVSATLLKRMDEIYTMPEQELLMADYFTYAQDAFPEWEKTINVSPASLDGQSMKLDVWLGQQNSEHAHLQVWTRKENGNWKIWRVVDAGDNIEQKLY